jgi:Zn-dependent protease with chaperone function
LDYTDYVHRVRLHEQASQDQPQAYRQRVFAFALLGYALIALLGLLALGGLSWVAWMLIQGQFRGWMLLLGLSSLGLLWATLSGLRVPFREPEGHELSDEEAPQLFEGLDRIRAKIKGPPLHAVLITEDFNAAIVQRPQCLGLRHRNYLLIGWPLLAAMEPRRVFAVLAHEYGHLRESHGQLSAWIYRSRAAWSRLLARYRDDTSPLAWLLAGSVRWYAPRFDAMSFALARDDEYAADRAAARIFGAEIFAQALQEVAVKGRLYEEHFWRHWWRLARLRDGGAPPAPHAQMASTLLHLSEPQRLQQALREALRSVANPSDTHPVLKDRLAALGQRGSSLTPQSARSALTLLGRARERISAALDAQWWQQNRQDWQRHGERLRALHADVRAFQARATVNDMLGVEDLLRWATGLKALSERDPSPVLERALQLSPRHEQVLLALVEHHAPLGTADARVADWLDRLYQEHPGQAWRAASLAQLWMNRCSDPAMLARLRPLWRERLSQAEAMEQQAWAQFAATPCWEQSLPLELDEDCLRQLKSLLLRQRDVRAAWLGAQRIEVQPARAHFTLWLQCRPGVGASAADDLAQQIHQTMELPGRTRVVLVDHQVERARVEQTLHLLALVQRR